MQDLTIDQAWEYCLAQWKWITEHLEEGAVISLKYRWLMLHKPEYLNIKAGCFFCELVYQNDGGCELCPGGMVSRFHCGDITYNYNIHPRRFYRKLLQLDEKRRNEHN